LPFQLLCSITAVVVFLLYVTVHCAFLELCEVRVIRGTRSLTKSCNKHTLMMLSCFLDICYLYALFMCQWRRICVHCDIAAGWEMCSVSGRSHQPSHA